MIVNLKGRICLITGASSGIGKATALGLARAGATIVMVSREHDKGQKALSEIKEKTGNESMNLMVADLSSQQSVRKLAEDFADGYQHLHVLINNAGLFLPKRNVTVDGIETTFAVNHLAPFLLTNLLLDILKSGAPSRIVNVSSVAHWRGHINFEDLQGEKEYSGARAYCQSKLGNILFTYALARRLAGTGVTANCLHPGAVATNLVRRNSGAWTFGWRLISPFMASPEKAAQICMHLASSPEVERTTGKYFVKKAAVPSSPESYDEDIAERLWRVSAQLAGLG
jgi:NAD(P)-dependent dehydrogenase (short-subunit alcohol dehydrogenase family)